MHCRGREIHTTHVGWGILHLQPSPLLAVHGWVQEDAIRIPATRAVTLLEVPAPTVRNTNIDRKLCHSLLECSLFWYLRHLCLVFEGVYDTKYIFFNSDRFLESYFLPIRILLSFLNHCNWEDYWKFLMKPIFGLEGLDSILRLPSNMRRTET